MQGVESDTMDNLDQQIKSWRIYTSKRKRYATGGLHGRIMC